MHCEADTVTLGRWLTDPILSTLLVLYQIYSYIMMYITRMYNTRHFPCIQNHTFTEKALRDTESEEYRICTGCSEPDKCTVIGFSNNRSGHQLRYINSWSDSHDNWYTGTLLNRIITAQWEGMGDVGSARYELALLPPCPTIRGLCYSNCQRTTHSISKWIFKNLAL